MEAFDSFMEYSLETDRLQKEIANLFAAMDSNIESLHTIKFVQEHIEKFGVTNEAVHLLNQNNQLADLMQTFLPSCEEIEEGASVGSSIVISEEGFTEGLKKGFQIIVRILKSIIEALGDMFGVQYAHAMAVRLKLNLVKKKYEKDHDEEAFDNSKVNMIPRKEWDVITKGILANWEDMSKSNFFRLKNMINNGHKEFKIDVNHLNAVLEGFGHQIKIEGDKNKKFVTVPFKGANYIELPEDKETVHSLGWDFRSVKEGFKTCDSILDFITKDTIIKHNIEEMKHINRQMIDISAQKKFPWLTHDDPEYFGMVQSSLKLYSDTLLCVMRGMLKLSWWFGRFASQCKLQHSEEGSPRFQTA